MWSVDKNKIRKSLVYESLTRKVRSEKDDSMLQRRAWDKGVNAKDSLNLLSSLPKSTNSYQEIDVVFY
jgi:hypothetical protein